MFRSVVESMRDRLTAPHVPAAGASETDSLFTHGLLRLCPAYFSLLRWAGSVSDRQVSIVFRTFGSDLPEVITYVLLAAVACTVLCVSSSLCLYRPLCLFFAVLVPAFVSLHRCVSHLLSVSDLMTPSLTLSF